MTWKVIEDYPNYSVSDDGEVRNDKTGKILKHAIREDGYHRIMLGRKMHCVHRLVALHYVENPNVKHFTIIDHIDGQIDNNVSTNLRWCNRYLNDLNTKVYKNNKSGKKGIHFDKDNIRWCATYSINGKQKKKRFKNIEDAVVWRNEMVEQHYNKDFYRDK